MAFRWKKTDLSLAYFNVHSSGFGIQVLKILATSIIRLKYRLIVRTSAGSLNNFTMSSSISLTAQYHLYNLRFCIECHFQGPPNFPSMRVCKGQDDVIRYLLLKRRFHFSTEEPVCALGLKIKQKVKTYRAVPPEGTRSLQTASWSKWLWWIGVSVLQLLVLITLFSKLLLADSSLWAMLMYFCTIPHRETNPQQKYLCFMRCAPLWWMARLACDLSLL